jgi:cysteinyl-tRNA synthetase
VSGGSVPPIPDEVLALASEREAARSARDYSAADALRERIEAAGYRVTDTPDGPRVEAAPDRTDADPRRGPLRPEDVPTALGDPPTVDVTVHWLVEGWPEDVLRGIASFADTSTSSGLTSQHVVVDLVGVDAAAWPPGVEALRLDPAIGWAAARNAGLDATRGRIALVVDGSVEATGDVLGPLAAALDDRTVGITGPFGLLSDDLRDFRETPGPTCDAVEAYAMAFRRDLLLRGVRFDPKFRFYRSADIEFSFQVKALGMRATVTPVPMIRHEHRMWAATPEGDRDRLSKRNFYRFLDRWRGRSDLLVSRGETGPAGSGAPGSEGQTG